MHFITSSFSKFLGKNYKWWFLIVYHFKVMTQYRLNTVIWAVYGFVSLGITLSVWYVNRLNGSLIDFNELITYIVIGSFYSSAINVWVQEEISQWIKHGKLVTKILYPTSFIERYFFEFIGKAFCAEFLIKGLAYFILLPLVYNYLKPANSLSNIVLTILFVPISFTIIYLFDLIIGFISFWVIDYGSVGGIMNLIVDFLKGAFIPLYILFSLSSTFNFLNYLPFAFLLHHPMQIYLGKYDTNQTILVFLGGLAWCLVLYILAKIVFKLGLKRNESVGL